MTSPLADSYTEPFTHPAFGYRPQTLPREHWAIREQISALRATERRAEALAVAEAARIVAREAGRAER